MLLTRLLAAVGPVRSIIVALEPVRKLVFKRPVVESTVLAPVVEAVVFAGK